MTHPSDPSEPPFSLSLNLKKHPATRTFDPTVPASTAAKPLLVPQPAPKPKPPLYAIPIALGLAILLALVVLLIVLARRGKLNKFGSRLNPYTRRAKRQAQIERVAKVEAERARGLEEMGHPVENKREKRGGS